MYELIVVSIDDIDDVGTNMNNRITNSKNDTIAAIV